MAWRIDEEVICGEIDNRRRGRVTGRIWLAGHPEPVQLNLQGNCWRDLAGRSLWFNNPRPRMGGLISIDLLQDGVVGDITASRRVRVPDLPSDALTKFEQAGSPAPWCLGNALYLEWFGQRNGRVVIEGATFELKIIGESVWDMSAEEQRMQHEANGTAIMDFMKRRGSGRPRAGGGEGRDSDEDGLSIWTR